MRHRYLYPLLVLTLALVVSACGLIQSKTKSQTQKTVAAATPYADGARRVTIEEMESLVK